jgi:hypothetical protein
MNNSDNCYLSAVHEVRTMEIIVLLETMPCSLIGRCFEEHVVFTFVVKSLKPFEDNRPFMCLETIQGTL